MVYYNGPNPNGEDPLHIFALRESEKIADTLDKNSHENPIVITTDGLTLLRYHDGFKPMRTASVVLLKSNNPNEEEVISVKLYKLRPPYFSLEIKTEYSDSLSWKRQFESCHFMVSSNLPRLKTYMSTYNLDEEIRDMFSYVFRSVDRKPIEPTFYTEGDYDGRK